MIHHIQSFVLLFVLLMVTAILLSYIVDHEMHDGLGHEVSDALIDNCHVGVHQVADSLHFALQLRVHGEVICGGGALTLHLDRKKEGMVCDTYNMVRS